MSTMRFYTPPAPGSNSIFKATQTNQAVQPTMSDEEFQQKLSGLASGIQQRMSQPGGLSGVPAPPQNQPSNFYTPPAPPSTPFQPSPMSSPVPAPPTVRAVQPTMSNEDFQKNLPQLVGGVQQRMDQPGGFAGPSAPWLQPDRSMDNKAADIPRPPVPAPSGTPAPQAPSVPQSNVPAPSMPGQLNDAQIKAEAAARIAKQRAGLAGAVDYTKTGLKNNFDYTQGRLQDARVLENGFFQRNNDPMNGHTDYLAADMLRNRSIADTAANKDYNAATAAEDAKLASFDAMAPEQQAAVADELTRIERQYGLDVGSLTGNFNGGRTLAGQGQDASFTGLYNGQPTLAARTADQNYQLGLSGLSGQLPGGGQTLAGQQQANNQANQDRNYNLDVRKQHIQEAQDLSDRYGIQVQPTDDYQLMLNQVKGLPTTAQQNAQQKAQTDQQSQAWKASETLGYIPPQYADILGIPAYTQTQQAKQQAMANAVADRNAATAEKNATTAAEKANQQPQPKPVKIAPKESSDNYTQFADTNNFKGWTKAEVLQSLQKNADQFTDADYNKVKVWIDNNF